MIVLNDLHLGAKRSGGTTPASREALRTYIFDQFKQLMSGIDDDCVIVGDLFDGFDIDNRDFAQSYLILADWLQAHPGQRLILLAGNHDEVSRGQKVSSFSLLGTLLESHFNNVSSIGINEMGECCSGVKYITHCSNQDIFDLKLEEALENAEEGDFVLLHANYDNNFAAQSDHSLNVSSDVARQFCEKGVTLVFAHEHQTREEIPHGLSADAKGRVVVLGNQFGTSCSDWLGGTDKYYWRLQDA